LVIEGQGAPLVQLVSVISFEDFLLAVVQLSIADQKSYATRCKKVPMRLRETVDGTAEPDCIVLPPPRTSLDRDAARHAAIDVSKRQDFGLAVIPTRASEDADVLSDRLLHVGVEAIFGQRVTDAHRRSIDVERRIGRHHGQRLTIAGGVALVSK
jgi:hypothetical protein